MRLRHSKAYDQLARLAGKAAGLKAPTAEAVGADEAARAARDLAWDEYELRLRDTQTYTIDALEDWLKSQKVKVGRGSVHRDRAAILQKERAIAIAASKARAVLEVIESTGEKDLLHGSRALAGQLIFNTLTELASNPIEDMTASQVIKLINSAGYLSKTYAETDMIHHKLAEAQKRFDEEMTAAQAAASGDGGGAITDEMIARIRKRVFGIGVSDSDKSGGA